MIPQLLSISGELRSALTGLEKGAMDLDGFLVLWRRAALLVDDLPPRYREVLESVLLRLESSRFFSEESCSFSRSGLLQALESWLDKADTRARAQAQAGSSSQKGDGE